MLVNLNKVLEIAEKEQIAIGAFNCPSLEVVRAVIASAEELKVPVIIAQAQVHNEIIPLAEIGPILVQYAQRATVPVCVHLDHAVSEDLIHEAIDIGFTSVMIDASAQPFEDNVAISRRVVEYAHARNVSVEGELGTIDSSADSVKETEGETSNIYTDPAQAKEFVERTGIDALAASFGTVHGIYLSEPKLDFDRVRELREATGIPIVMHGGSGLSEEDYVRTIRNGVRKINYFSYMARTGARAVKEYLEQAEGTCFYTDLTEVARKAMQKEVLSTMKIFAGKE